MVYKGSEYFPPLDHQRVSELVAVFVIISPCMVAILIGRDVKGMHRSKVE